MMSPAPISCYENRSAPPPDNNYPFFRRGDNIGIDSGTNWNDIAGIVQGGIPDEPITLVHSMHRIETDTGLEV
jgi:hypothetical protein